MAARLLQGPTCDACQVPKRAAVAISSALTASRPAAVRGAVNFAFDAVSYMRVGRSDAGVPLVSLVLPVATHAARDAREALDELEADDVLGMLVSELALDAQAERRAVLDGQRLVVELVGEKRLRMHRVQHVDAFVVEPGTVVLHRIGAIEHDVSRLRFDTGRFEQRGEPRALPLADRAPALDA